MFKIKKTSKISDFKKKPRCRAFYGVIFSVILFLGLFNGFLTKNASATNNYFEVKSFYKDNQGKYRVQIHVLTTFTEHWYLYTTKCALLSKNGTSGMPVGPIILNPTVETVAINYDLIDTSSCRDITYTAGNTYDLYLQQFRPGMDGFRAWFLIGEPKTNLLNYFLNSSNYTFTSNTFIDKFYYDTPNYSQWYIVDDGNYYFKEIPSLTITFPHNNDEIAGAFYVQGSYTIPASSTYYALLAGFFPIGTYDPYNFNRNVGAFSVNISPPSGNFSIPNWQLPAGYYDIHFRFIGIGEQYDAPEYISNVHLVNDIPPSLPTGETPPTIPIYPATSPETYHANYCSYGTSTTPLFNTLTGAVGGLITNIGQSLADFADRFKLTDAQNTGQQLANSVLLMRSYVATLNSFFGDLPVSQILILYLIVFVLVILFRLIKSLINLIKP